MFAKDPAKFFLQAVVVCAVFQGKGKAKIIDKRTVGGTIVECYTGTMAYLREHLNTEYVIRGGPREEILELPEEALREAILNALAHRDYRLTGAIQVHIFSDRVEMLNPGSLVSGLRIEDLGHVSRPRNPLLFGLMDRMELVENVGSGIKRIRDAMNEYGLRPPLIRTAETWFSITFRRKKPDEAIESLSRKGIGEPARPGSPIGSSKGSPITRERIITLIAESSNHQRCHRIKFADYEKAVLKQIRRLRKRVCSAASVRHAPATGRLETTMPDINLTEQEVQTLLRCLNERVEPPEELAKKLFPKLYARFDFKTLNRASIPTIEYAGKRSEATILNEASAFGAGSPLQIVRFFRGGKFQKEVQQLELIKETGPPGKPAGRT